MSKLMIFPWFNRKELEKVYKELYSDSIIQQKHALGRVAVWKSRALYKFPVAVETTAALVSANLECRRTATRRGEDVRVRGIYSFAVMRFVNHITEKRQTAPFALPIHRLASELGVPEWIVDLRHEATHGELPALTILKTAADWALQWLKKEFWELQLANPSDETEKDSKIRERQFVQDILGAYQKERFTMMTDLHEHDVFALETLHNNSVNKDVESLVSDYGLTMCEILSEPGYLVLSKEQLESLNLTESVILQDGLHLPQSIVSFWTPIIRLMLTHDMLNELLMHLVATVTEEASLKNKFLLSWIFTVVMYSTGSRHRKGSLFHVKELPVLPYKQLLDTCIQKTNPFSVELIELLLDQIDAKQFSDERKVNIRQLMTLYFNPSEETQSKEGAGDKDHSTKDICEAKSKKASGRWFRCIEPIDWSRCALGLLPNQSLDYNCLELGEEEEEEVVLEEKECMETETVSSSEESDVDDVDYVESNLDTWDDRTISSVAAQVQKGILNI